MDKDTDVLYMRRALALAAEALENGEVPVGAVVVRDGKILGEGRNRREESRLSTAHAEVLAVEAACRAMGDWRLDGCTLYVTLEPCPMCAGALSQARISRVVYGAFDPSRGALGGLLALQTLLPDWKPSLTGGVLSEDAQALLGQFFADTRARTRPKRLLRDFFARPADVVARELLGKVLCVRDAGTGEVRRAEITETEAYFGENDTASHASRGKTDRNRPMFSRGGTVYVYLCYGLHNMLNLVTGEKGSAEAVLIRGVRGAYGPGKLTALLGVDRRLNEADAVLSDAIWVEDGGTPLPAYTTGPRVGIAYAAEKDREALLRFTVKD